MSSENPQAPTRDWLEVVFKIITSIVLVIIPIVIKYGADNIATSLQSGELVQKLLSDLTTKDEKTRQDIALIALDGAIGEKQPEMVGRISEAIIRSRIDSAPGDDVLSSVAYQIVEKRTPERTQKLIDQIANINPSKAVEVLARGQTNEELRTGQSDRGKLLAMLSGKLVYIQFRGETNRELAKKLQQYLNQAGYTAPGVEQIGSNYPNEVRYFNVGDKELAQSVADAVNRYFQQEHIAVQVTADKKSGKAPTGQVEVWFGV